MVRVRHEGRSKGCENCRKRKIKCDEQLPECSQCLKSGKECGGAVAGFVFLHATSGGPLSKAKKLVHERERKRQDGANPQSSHFGKNSPHRQRITSPDLVQISSEHVMAQKFISIWIDVCEGAGLSWMSQIPNMLPASEFKEVEKSILAASLVYHGHVSNDRAMMVEAYKLYGLGLKKQRKQIQALQLGKKKPSLQEVCLPIMLSFYEIVSWTNPMAYFHHIMGAMRLLEMMGPGACQEGPVAQLYQVVKAQMIYISIILRKQSFLAQQKWISVHIMGRPKTAFDKVVDILTLIPGLLSKFDLLQKTPKPEISSLKHDIAAHAMHLRRRLNLLWNQLREELHLPEDPNEVGYDATTDQTENQTRSTPSSTNINLKGIPEAISHYADQASLSIHPYSAIAVAFYDTAQILILSVLVKFQIPSISSESSISLSRSTFPLNMDYAAEIERHSASIITMADIISRPEAGAAYISMVLPMRILGESSPSKEQRERCKMILQKWEAKGGIGSLMCKSSLLDMQERWEMKAAV